MNNQEIKTLEHFLARTSMWIYPVNEVSIVSFISGFEAGINNKIFTSALKEYLQTEYDIYGSNAGWPRQISLYGEKRNIEWVEAFIEIGSLIVIRVKELS